MSTKQSTGTSPDAVRLAKEIDTTKASHDLGVSESTYGSPRITGNPRALGHRINEKQVTRLMRMLDLTARQPRRHIVTTDSDHDDPIAPDLIRQDFTAGAPR